MDEKNGEGEWREHAAIGSWEAGASIARQLQLQSIVKLDNKPYTAHYASIAFHYGLTHTREGGTDSSSREYLVSAQ